MNWIKHHTQTVVALTCIGATLLFCAYAIIDYESDQCHYREIVDLTKLSVRRAGAGFSS